MSCGKDFYYLIVLHEEVLLFSLKVLFGPFVSFFYIFLMRNGEQ